MTGDSDSRQDRALPGESLPRGVPPELVRALAAEISERIAGGRIRKVKSPSPHSLMLVVSAGARKEHLFISAHRLFPRINLSSAGSQGMPSPSPMCEALRPALQNRAVLGAAQIGSDRIIAIDLAPRSPGSAPISLVVEFIPRVPNVFLVEGGEVLFVLNAPNESRGTGPGRPYYPPARRKTADPPADGPVEGAESPSEFVEKLLDSSETRAEMEALSAKILKTAAARLRKARIKHGKLSADFERTAHAESIRRKGEIIKANLRGIEKGARTASFPDMYGPCGAQAEIELDPSLSPRLNMERYFAKYKKLKRGREKIASLIKAAETSIAGLLKTMEEVRAGGSQEHLRETAAGLGIEGAPQTPTAPAPKARDSGAPKGIRHFMSADGYDIFVGKGGAENEKLTFCFARGSDMWLHVSGVPGPHVVIRVKEEGLVPQETLLDAAALAVFFSKARGRVAEVVYSWKKNLARPRKGKPGLVYVANRRTMRMGLEEQRLARLLRKDE